MSFHINYKRIIIFVLILLLLFFAFLTENNLLRGVYLLIILIFFVFVIFSKSKTKSEDEEEEIPEPITSIENPVYEPDHGESFEIVSQNKKIEIITAENIGASVTGSKKAIFKPPDLKESFIAIAKEEVPQEFNHKQQFSYVLERILAVVQDSFIAHSALFFFYDAKQQKIILEKHISHSNDIDARKFDLEDDILSKIILTEEPELLTEIVPTAEKDVIRYYTQIQGIKSFVGVPLYFENKLMGILAIDAKVSDAFGIETVYSLGRFVRIISIIIGLLKEKHSDSQAERKLNALLNLWGGERFFVNDAELYETLEKSLRNIIPWDAFAFVHFNPTDEKYTVTKVVNNTSLKYVGENSKIDVEGTLVGKSILSGSPVKIDDTSAATFNRFSINEDISFDGSFLSIPLIYDNQRYGALCFESLKNGSFTGSDVNFLSKSSKLFAFVIHSYSSTSILRNLLSVDPETKALNQKNFIERVNSDLAKANQFNAQGAMALIYIDEFLENDTLFEGNPFPKVLTAITEIIRSEITVTNIFGRLSERVFAIYFFNNTTKDVFLWAEKLRVKIARKPISVMLKQTTFTVSIGIAPAMGSISAEDAIYNADLALKKALEKGGNTVKNLS